MHKQEKASKVLSLHQEIEREAQEIEKEIAQHPELDKIQVTEEMDRILRDRIRAFEKEMAKERHAAKKAAEDLRELRGEPAEDMGEDGSGGCGMENVPGKMGGTGRFGKSDDHVEFSDELVPDLSEIVAHGNGKERKYEVEERNNENGKVVYRRKKRKYLLISLVAVLVIVLGVGVNSVGSKSYWKVFWDKVHGGEAMKVINVEDMVQQDSEDGDETAAYLEIEDKFHIKPVRILYKPNKMKLESYEIYEDILTAQFLYEYQDEIIRYIFYISDVDSSWGQKEEDKKIDEYTVLSNGIEIKVEEYQVLDSSENRQIANFEYQGVHYQLKGIIGRVEFEKILKNLYFF